MLHRRIFFYLVSIAFLAGCSTVPVTGRSQLSLVSHQQILALSRQNYETLIKESKFSDDPAKISMLEEVGNKVALATEEFVKEKGMLDKTRGFEWEFKLIEDDAQINAFVLPGGKVFVYTGLLPVSKDKNGLATVIGHEVAHVLANHGGERMSQLLLAQLGGITLAVAMREKSDDTRRLAMMAYGAGATVGVILPYSRVQEKEADRIGLILMAKAGFDPKEAIPFWERMKEANKGPRPPEFLSTHPVPAKRIEQIRQYLPEALEHYKP